MIRRWAVHPDMEIETDFGPLPIVSRGAFVEAVLDAVSLVDRAGGGFSVVAGRQVTGLDHEAVTTGLVIEWRDNANAKPAPERPSEVLPEPNLDAARDIAVDGEQPEGDDPTTFRAGEPPDDIGDGLDPGTLDEEDESSLETAR